MTTPNAETRLRNAGYRMTKQRHAVYEYLRSTDAHPTAETIHAAVRHQLPNIGLGTVYKAVDSLVEVGLVNRIQRGASSARYDASVEDHAHCRCLGCDGVPQSTRLVDACGVCGGDGSTCARGVSRPFVPTITSIARSVLGASTGANLCAYCQRIERAVRPSRSRRSLSRFKSSPCTDTSRPAVGSSARISLGSSASARATPTRRA